MKKSIFILLTTFLLVLVLLYLYNEREEILNKSFLDNNIYIIYPYFNNKRIDNDIIRYIDKYRSREYQELYIDYDYYIEDDMVNLTMYTYGVNNNLVFNDEKKFYVNGLSYDIDDFNYNGFNNNNDGNKLIALTFDDGPNYNTNRVLSILEKYNVKATFFVLGSCIVGHEDIIKRMNDLDMEIGNHMYSHKLVSKLTNLEIENEIYMVDELIYNIIGNKPKYIRPSYGSYNKRLKNVIDRPIIMWSNDTLDWKYHNSRRIASRLIKSVRDGDIILMHDIYRSTANSLEIIIPYLLKNNYKFVTVSELFYKKGIVFSNGNIYYKAN